MLQLLWWQNRQNERDRAQAQADYQTNIDAKLEIEALTKKNSIEVDKLDKIIRMLEQMEKPLIKESNHASKF
jgi:uncharacterized membrane protein